MPGQAKTGGGFRAPTHSQLGSALEGSEWSAQRPGHFTSGKDPLHIVQEAGLASGLIWTGAENLASTGNRSPYLQRVASRYTDWAIPAVSGLLWWKILYILETEKVPSTET